MFGKDKKEKTMSPESKRKQKMAIMNYYIKKRESEKSRGDKKGK